jgi:osmotically-inducible protein OsmY
MPNLERECETPMKRNILYLAFALALSTGLAIAQNPSAQQQTDQSQPMPQTQPQTPQTQQTPATPGPSSQTGTTGQSVQAQIQQQPELSGVTVNETSDKIELSGTVASKADKEKAKSIAEASAKGRKVANKIKVSESQTSSPSTPPPPR